MGSKGGTPPLTSSPKRSAHSSKASSVASEAAATAASLSLQPPVNDDDNDDEEVAVVGVDDGVGEPEVMASKHLSGLRTELSREDSLPTEPFSCSSSGRSTPTKKTGKGRLGGRGGRDGGGVGGGKELKSEEFSPMIKVT